MPKSTYNNLPPQRQQELLDAALNLFSEQEYAEITMEAICERLDLPTGTLYRYFKDKEDLFMAVMQYSVANDEITEDFVLTPAPGFDINQLNRREHMLKYNFRNAPEEVIRAYYFGPYRDRMFKEYYKDLLNLKFAGKLHDDLDVDLIAYMYTTTAYNLTMYVREKGLTDFEDTPLCYNIMNYFYYSFFMRGIRKPDATQENPGPITL